MGRLGKKNDGRDGSLAYLNIQSGPHLWTVLNCSWHSCLSYNKVSKAAIFQPHKNPPLQAMSFLHIQRGWTFWIMLLKKFCLITCAVQCEYKASSSVGFSLAKVCNWNSGERIHKIANPNMALLKFFNNKHVRWILTYAFLRSGNYLISSTLIYLSNVYIANIQIGKATHKM